MARKKISVIMPVYNTENYVTHSIESIIKQSIGFENNIELILVNNATEDKSGYICEEYANKYPDNIKYIVLNNNKGPSGARNAGLKEATGKYINYIDSDDLWEDDSLEHLANYLDKHFDEVDVAIGRLHHFDANDNWHILDWRFIEDERIVDIQELPNYIHLHLGSALIKSDVAKMYQHDENVYNAEDMHYLNKIIINSGRYALIKSACYLYRTRSTGDSTLQNVTTSKRWYINTVERVYQYFLDYSMEKWGYVIPYLQYLVMYECQWRFNRPISCEEIDESCYKESIKKLLKHIDDEIIMCQKKMWYERKLYAMWLKTDNNISKDEFMRDHYELSNGLHIKSLTIFNNKLHISGFMRYPYFCTYRLFVKYNNNETEVLFDGGSNNDIYSLNECIAAAQNFYFSIPYIKGRDISFLAIIGKSRIIQSIKAFKNTKYDKSVIGIENEIIHCL